MQESKTIQLLVVDDHQAFRLGLVAIIDDVPEMKVIAEAADGKQALEICAKLRPDIVLMDLRLPGLSGVEATLAIRQSYPETRVIVITTFDGDEDIYRALQSGAHAYLLKDMSKEELVDAIRAVHAGKYRLPTNVAGRLAERMRRPEITPRELEALKLIVKGKSNKEIASALSITEETVKGHLKSLFLKLEVNDRTQAAITALQRGFVHLD
ncbi:MAG: response regulator [Limisphaerales bacterium]